MGVWQAGRHQTAADTKPGQAWCSQKRFEVGFLFFQTDGAAWSASHPTRASAHEPPSPPVTPRGCIPRFYL